MVLPQKNNAKNEDIPDVVVVPTEGRVLSRIKQKEDGSFDTDTIETIKIVSTELDSEKTDTTPDSIEKMPERESQDEDDGNPDDLTHNDPTHKEVLMDVTAKEAFQRHWIGMSYKIDNIFLELANGLLLHLNCGRVPFKFGPIHDDLVAVLQTGVFQSTKHVVDCTYTVEPDNLKPIEREYNATTDIFKIDAYDLMWAVHRLTMTCVPEDVKRVMIDRCLSTHYTKKKQLAVLCLAMKYAPDFITDAIKGFPMNRTKKKPQGRPRLLSASHRRTPVNEKETYSHVTHVKKWHTFASKDVPKQEVGTPLYTDALFQLSWCGLNSLLFCDPIEFVNSSAALEAHCVWQGHPKKKHPKLYTGADSIFIAQLITAYDPVKQEAPDVDASYAKAKKENNMFQTATLEQVKCSIKVRTLSETFKYTGESSVELYNTLCMIYLLHPNMYGDDHYI